jgi:UDP-arabinose 4-epimerase
VKGTATVLVTGGAGYVGSHACKALSNAGYPPVVFDNLVRGHRSAVRWGPLEVGSIHDGDRLRAVLKKYQPAAVMHFAAYSDVAESVASPGKYYWNNVAGTLSLLNAMSAAGDTTPGVLQHMLDLRRTCFCTDG